MGKYRTEPMRVFTINYCVVEISTRNYEYHLDKWIGAFVPEWNIEIDTCRSTRVRQSVEKKENSMYWQS